MSLAGWPLIVGWVGVMWWVARPLGVRWARAASGGAAISPAQKAQLTAAFEALGPERVARGVTAAGHRWNDCFLALATYGAPGALRRALKRSWPAGRTRRVATLVAASPAAIRTVVRVWDRNEGAFRALAAAWLEQRDAPATTGAPPVVTEEHAS